MLSFLHGLIMVGQPSQRFARFIPHALVGA